MESYSDTDSLGDSSYYLANMENLIFILEKLFESTANFNKEYPNGRIEASEMSLLLDIPLLIIRRIFSNNEKFCFSKDDFIRHFIELILNISDNSRSNKWLGMILKGFNEEDKVVLEKIIKINSTPINNNIIPEQSFLDSMKNLLKRKIQRLPFNMNCMNMLIKNFTVSLTSKNEKFYIYLNSIQNNSITNFQVVKFYRIHNKKFIKYKMVASNSNLFLLRKHTNNHYYLEQIIPKQIKFFLGPQRVEYGGRLLHLIQMLPKYNELSKEEISEGSIILKHAQESEQFLHTLKLKIPSLKDYDILQDLDSGAKSNVYLCFNKNTSQTVAIKTIEKNKIKDINYDLFLNELFVSDYLNTYSHDNIVKFYEFFEDIETIYIVMDYSGDTLEKLLKNNRLNQDEKNSIGKQIIKGLEYLHSQGIIHRDLKPSNILVSKEFGKYHARIIDFNFSKFIFKDEKLNDTIGTLAYCAPEMFQNSPYDKNVDIWSLGVILFEIFIGHHPFDEDRSIELPALVQKICNDNSQIDLIERSSKVDSNWKEIIKFCLKKNSVYRLNMKVILEKCIKS